MKKERSLLIGLLVLASVATSQVNKKEYYDYKKTRLMADYQVNAAGEKNGWFKGYDQAGILVIENTYKHNVYDGVCKEYTTMYGKREIAKSETYKDGILEGPAVYYGQGGMVLHQGSFKAGKKDGKWVNLDLYKNYDLGPEEKKGAALIKTEDSFKDGQQAIPDGPFKAYFYPSGKVYSEQEFKDGKRVGVCKWYYPNGTLQAEELHNGQGGTTIYKEYWPDGKLKSSYDHATDTYIGYGKDGSPDQRMQNEQNAKQQEKEKANRRGLIAKGDSVLKADGNADEAIKYYQAANESTEALRNFLKLWNDYTSGKIDARTLSDKSLFISDYANYNTYQGRYIQEKVNSTRK